MTFPLTSVAGIPVTVLGAARSGIAVAKLLSSREAQVFVSDKGAEGSLAGAAEALTAATIPFEFGKHSERAYACDLMVISPGVPTDAPVVQEAIRRGIGVVSEIECASWFCTGPIAAVTGSNGKTTTTTLLGRMLGDARVPHAVGGNIGTAFSSFVDGMSEGEIAVLEVSSFQLDHIRSFHPAVSVLLNITPDHMDRYGNSMEHYAASKARITLNQTRSDMLIYNADDGPAGRIAARAHSMVLPFSLARKLTDGAWLEGDELISSAGGSPEPIIRTGDMSLRGEHNVANAMAAVLAAQRFGVGAASIRATLKNFKGVEHRLEFVRDVNGITFVNDSKATNVDSVLVALKAFAEPIVLLLGGRDKGNDYSLMTDLVKKHVRAIVAIGESSDKVIGAFSGVVPVKPASSMDDAIATAVSLASKGDVVLLSPACASFDWFRNYEHRGTSFKDIVKAL